LTSDDLKLHNLTITASVYMAQNWRLWRNWLPLVLCA